MSKTKDISRIEGEVGAHSYADEEVQSFSDYINSRLQDDEDLKDKLPLEGNALFEAVKDGILLCKMINVASPKTIDERVINKKNLNPWKIGENFELGINSASSIGVKTVNITKSSIQEGKQHIILGLFWQVIKIALFQKINLKQHPELVRLLKEGEEYEDFLKQPTEDILVRWVNFHLQEAGSEKRMNNFSSDIKDSVIYTQLLKQISRGVCGESPLEEEDLEKRAEKVLEQADKIQCRKFVRANDIIKGNPRLNLGFVATLFNNYPALEEVDVNDYAELLNFDAEGSREERSFMYWIQSLGPNITNLFDGLRDGVVLAEVIDKIKPNTVEWKKLKNNPRNKFEAVANCNYAIELAKNIGIKVAGVGGTDLYDKNRKLVLGVVWQLYRMSLLDTMKELGDGKPITDDDILAWANKKVADMKIENFGDEKLKDGVFLIKLCHAVSPHSCDLSMISEENEMNAKYALSVARKIGAVVFTMWEDIVEAKPKMILAFVASLMKADMQKKQKE